MEKEESQIGKNSVAKLINNPQFRWKIAEAL